MRSKTLILLIFVLIMSARFYSQDIVNVPPGDGTLRAAIESATDESILKLIPGAEYTEPDNYNFGTITDKKITIEFDGDESSPKAIIKITDPSDGSSTLNFFQVGDKSSLTLRGLEFDGMQNETATVNHLIQFSVGSPPVETNIGNLRIENCIIHDLTGSVLDGGSTTIRGYCILDSCFVDNVIMTNTGTSIYFKYNGCNYISMTNSTFNTISSYGLRVSGPGETTLSSDYTPEAIIDHTTWFNIGLDADPREILLQEKGPNLRPWTVTNSIFVSQTSTIKTVINIKEGPGSIIKNICMWNVGPRKWSNNIVSDTLIMDPMFKDTVAGDFTLPKGSPLLTYGTDGKAIGDPRWATNAPVSVEKGKNVITDYYLKQNYPNPFNPSTKIVFGLKEQGFTTINIFNSLGEKITTLINRQMSQGVHEVVFNADNIPSGIYYYQLRVNNVTITNKMMLLK